MKFPLTVCVFLLTVISSLSVDITVRGTERGRVSIKCPYPGGYKNSYKYFYKGVFRESVIILRSDGGKSKDRFTLQDDRKTRSFTVTIRNLKMEDAGIYGCRAGWGEYKEIRLIVNRAPQKPKPVQISTSTIRPFTNTSTEHTSTESETRTTIGNATFELHQQNTNLASVAGGLGSVLLVLTLCSGIFLILKKRKRKCGTALVQLNVQHNTETDRMYEEIPNSDVAAVTYSSNQMPASHLNNRPELSTVYAKVTNQQPDLNPSHTNSTNQVTDTDCDYYATIKSPDPTQDSRTELIYVTATHPQKISTNEGPIYSLINDELVKLLSKFIMWDVLLLFSSICTAVVVGAPDTVTGHRGERVEIRCPYEPGYESNSKYFCKGHCLLSNKIIIKSGSPAQHKRFSLTDDTTNRVLTVTITDLRTEDQGKYWCGVQRNYAVDVYSEIMLLVKEDKKITEVSTISSFSETQSSFSTTDLNLQSVTHRTVSETARTGNTTVELHQPITNLASVAGGLGSVLLVLTLCSGTILILKKRKRKCGTALVQQNVQHNTETDRTYEEIPNRDVAMETSSSNQTPALDLNNLPEVSAVYATVTKQQPDSNLSHTHSTNQVTNPDCDYYATIKSPDPTQDSRTELIYVTATHPQKISTHPQIISRNEGVIYSTIKHK
ncbi:polymeric immunoglobulin receptor-like [Chanodichthys erythropterus]|uniref:polymeric immunoglobulin receptor-like n=1 Tax=Chanodichthys erythropterus TaxID=933992 RepID=UPI00351F6D78